MFTRALNHITKKIQITLVLQIFRFVISINDYRKYPPHFIIRVCYKKVRNLHECVRNLQDYGERTIYKDFFTG